MFTHRVWPGGRFFGEFYAEWQRRVGGPVTTPEVYEAHIRTVRAAVDKARLLEFQPVDGYGPLCKFLSLPVPDEPYPRLNDTEFMIKLASVGVLFGLLTWVIILSTGLALAYGAWSFALTYNLL